MAFTNAIATAELLAMAMALVVTLLWQWCQSSMAMGFLL